jgi:hypothetical protein
VSELAWLVLPALASTVVTGGVLRACGVDTRRALWAGVAAGILTDVVVVVVFLTFLGECLSENHEPPPNWPWSPRRQFCQGGSSEARDIFAVLVVPTILVTVGTLLYSRQHVALAWGTYSALFLTVFVPHIYVNMLPYYWIDSTPVLSQPVLRAAVGSQPARVCYVYGIYGKPSSYVTPDSTRELYCVDLKPTPAAQSLTARDEAGTASLDLETMGNNLTARGLPIHPGETGVEGLVVTRAYKLPAVRAYSDGELVQNAS